MAPYWPEEVDVFTVPHSRMKKLIHLYNNMVMSTDFRDKINVTSLLQNLHNVVTELKAHEQIENTYIMGELRNKLHAASIRNPAVCNCHSDNRLLELQDLVLDGFEWAEKPQRERQMYGRKLRTALEIFTQNFLPHMDMEEEVFQPMLMEYFSYEELKALKLKVIKQHGISNYEENFEKFVSDSNEAEEPCSQAIDQEEEPCHFDRLPNEICHQILSYLGPKDLSRVGRLSHRWTSLTQDPNLWNSVFPVHWAMGHWSFQPPSLLEGALESEDWPGKYHKEQLYFCTDEDADVDESGGDTDTYGDRTDTEEERFSQIVHEAKLLTNFVKYMLPKVGSGVRHFELAFSRGLSNNLVHKILKLCPNLEVLNLQHTLVGDAAFREFRENGRLPKLRHLDLSGCENISDLTLHSLANRSALMAAGVSMLSLSDNEWEKDVFDSQDSNVSETEMKNCCGDVTKKESKTVNSLQENSLQKRNSDKNDVSRCSSPKVSVCEDTNDKEAIQPKHQDETIPNNLPCESFTGGYSVNNKENKKNCCSHYTKDLPFELSCCQQPASASHCSYEGTKNKNFIDCGGCQVKTQTGYRGNSNHYADVSKDICELWDCVKNNNTDHYTTDSDQDISQQSLCGSKISKLSENLFDTSEKRSGKYYNPVVGAAFSLEFLSLSGCYRVTSEGISALSEAPGMPSLTYLDLSGCVNVCGQSLRALVLTSQCLEHANLFYCDNIPEDPFPTTASGCRNRDCSSRSLYCCSMAE